MEPNSPLSADDGEVIARLAAGPDGATHPVWIKIPPNRSQGGVRVFVDPTAELEAVSPVRLRHPETGLARVEGACTNQVSWPKSTN